MGKWSEPGLESLAWLALFVAWRVRSLTPTTFDRSEMFFFGKGLPASSWRSSNTVRHIIFSLQLSATAEQESSRGP